MKKKMNILLLFLMMVSCQVEGSLTNGNEPNEITETAIHKNQGKFEPTSGISVSGKAEIIIENGQYKVNLVNFSVSNGPDLKIYLSKAATPTQFINLGNLTSQTVYTIPLGVNIDNYSHVLVYCQQYNHLFAIATLIQN